ncbi:hypothetical protein CEXT_287251 [Caerostris extrusa]|uniref:Uncharacterized protein n=1 Tax=Caerostris extrusa TaxID=172846 RepID=A0AAV4XJ16_CAEEX|nr:hypothetical protein CEXT_287251 [Caerostris extrusa]
MRGSMLHIDWRRRGNSWFPHPACVVNGGHAFLRAPLMKRARVRHPMPQPFGFFSPSTPSHTEIPAAKSFHFPSPPPTSPVKSGMMFF